MRDGASDVLIYHYYKNDGEKDQGILGKNTLSWDGDGWPVVSAAEVAREGGGSTTSEPPTGILPVTGTQIGLISGLGLVTLAAGVLMYLLARRRRIRFASVRE
jgi:LPXTG-motif cell wall-anchored protein